MSDEGFLMNLPSHIIVEILSRLPAITVINSKLVCKKWLTLISTPEFAKVHLSRSNPGLAVFQHEPGGGEVCRLFEFEDDIDHHDLHYDPVIKFEVSVSLGISRGATGQVGSINGLVCLRNFHHEYDALYVCNPITREYVALPVLDWLVENPSQVTYGFGLSTISGKYKVVRIFHEGVVNPTTGAWLSISKSTCHVYTLGTDSWRAINGDVSFGYSCRSVGPFFNGNLHWVIQDLQGSELISCFDVEKESFQPFPPPFPGEPFQKSLHSLGVVAGCLCLCDNTSDSEIVIWIMKEYGVKKSWIKEFVISKVPDFAGPAYEMVHALKFFENDDILLTWDDYCLFLYRNQSKTLQKVKAGPNYTIQTMLHVPSFVSIKDFVLKENIRVF